MAQALTVRPLTIRGTAKGMKRTVATAVSSMNAAVNPRSPFALSTIIGRNGAQGVIPSRMSPIAYGSASGMTRVIR